MASPMFSKQDDKRVMGYPITMYCYLIRCKDDTFYTGISKSPYKRFEQHKKGRGAIYLKKHKPKEMYVIREFDSWNEAKKYESWLKKQNMSRKESLIWRSLYPISYV